MGKCRASHRLRIMAVGLGLEAKKLRWMWKGGDRSQSAALLHPRLYPSASQPTQGQDLPLAKLHWIPWLLVVGVQARPTELLTHPTHPLPPGRTAGGLCSPSLPISHPPVQVEFLGQSPPVSTPATGRVEAGNDLLPNEEGDLEGTGAH